MPNRVGHFCSETWDIISMVLGGLKDVSIWTVAGARVCVVCNVLAMLYVAYLLGLNPWITIASSLIAVSAVWLRVQMRREREVLALLLEKQKEWDIDKTLKEYAELLKKRGKREERSAHAHSTLA